jgi:hypothetical protein
MYRLPHPIPCHPLHSPPPPFPPGLAHAQHIPTDDPTRLWNDPPPESVDALGEVAAFFDRTLGGNGKGAKPKTSGSK